MSVPKDRFKLSHDRQWQINQQNNHLLSNLMQIEKRGNQYLTNPTPHFFHQGKRRLEQEAIHKENIKIYKNLSRMKPTTSVGDWKQHQSKAEQFGKYFSQFDKQQSAMKLAEKMVKSLRNRGRSLSDHGSPSFRSQGMYSTNDDQRKINWLSGEWVPTSTGKILQSPIISSNESPSIAGKQQRRRPLTASSVRAPVQRMSITTGRNADIDLSSKHGSTVNKRISTRSAQQEVLSSRYLNSQRSSITQKAIIRPKSAQKSVNFKKCVTSVTKPSPARSKQNSALNSPVSRFIRHRNTNSTAASTIKNRIATKRVSSTFFQSQQSVKNSNPPNENQVMQRLKQYANKQKEITEQIINKKRY